MFESSMMLTIGAALDRAQVEGLLVQISVSGQWIPGRVVNTDQHGVAFLEASGDMCVFRPESIAGVRMPQRSHDAHHHHRPTASQRAPIEAHAVAVN